MAASAQAPITLRLASPDVTGRASEEPIQFFADEVARESGGSITIEPVFDVTSDDPNLTFEQYAADRVKAGEYELGVIASRGWDKTGITTPWALQAPFLIDNDALAIAVATSDAAQEVLDGMAGVGVTGLVPVAGGPPTSVRVRAIRQAIPQSPMTSRARSSGPSRRTLAGSCCRPWGPRRWSRTATGETSSWASSRAPSQGCSRARRCTGHPTATGNVTFFPKFEVLVANSAAIAQLSDDAAVHPGLGRDRHERQRHRRSANGRPGRTGLVHQAQGRIVLASDAQVGAFEAAAAPIYAELEADPAVKAIIDDIRALKAGTPRISVRRGLRAGAAADASHRCRHHARDAGRPHGTYQAAITERGPPGARAGPRHVRPDSDGTVLPDLRRRHPGHCTRTGDSPERRPHISRSAARERGADRLLRACWEERSIDLQWTSGADGGLDLDRRQHRPDLGLMPTTRPGSDGPGPRSSSPAPTPTAAPRRPTGSWRRGAFHAPEALSRSR